MKRTRTPKPVILTANNGAQKQLFSSLNEIVDRYGVSAEQLESYLSVANRLPAGLNIKRIKDEDTLILIGMIKSLDKIKDEELKKECEKMLTDLVYRRV